MKRERAGKYVAWIGIAALTLFGAAGFLALPKRTFSDNENRLLAQAPAFSMAGIRDGRFMADFEDYLADQFPLRDRLFALSVRAQRLTGKRELNGVFLCGDRLIDVYEEPKNTEKFIKAAERLTENLDRARVIVLTVPTAAAFCADELPAAAEARMPVAQTETIRRISEALAEGGAELWMPGGSESGALLAAFAAGRAQGEEMFYRTDHHWTTRGAYQAARLLAPALGISADDIPADGLTVVSDTFYGTTWSKVCDPSIAPDIIEIYENPAWEGRLRVICEDTGEISDSPYNKEYLKKKDQYSMFLNNLHPLITIENPAPDGARREAARGSALAVVGDSYKNSLVPFLIDQYETIYIFDPRYYRGGISAFVNGHPEIGDVLVIYNLGTMDNDRGIGAID